MRIVVISLASMLLLACSSNQSEPGNLPKEAMKQTELPVVMEQAQSESSSIDAEKASGSTEQPPQVNAESGDQSMSPNNGMSNDVSQPAAESEKDISGDKTEVVKEKQPATTDSKS